jgi:O-antigen/teichoic acid export membrane protein
MSKLSEKLGQELRFLRSKMTRPNVIELAWVLAGQTVTLLMGFVVLKLLTQMGKDAFGEYTLTLTISALLGLILYGPVEQGFIRFYYHYAQLSRTAGFVRLMYRFLLWSAGAFLIGSLLFASGALWLAGRRLAILGLVAGIFVISQKADEFFNTALNVIRKRKENYILQGAHKIATAGLLYLLYRYQQLFLVQAMIALTAVTFLAVLAKALNYDKHIPRDDPPPPDLRADRAEMVAQLRRYVLPFLIWGVAGWLQLYGEKWILARLLSVGDVGVYAVMLSVVNVLLNIPNAMLMEYINPIVFRHYADLGNREELQIGHRYIRITVVAVIGLTLLSILVTYFAGRPIIVLISNQGYTGFAQLLPLLSAGTGLFLVGQAMCSMGMGLNLPGRYLAPKILIGLISVAANVLLIRARGIDGIAYAAILVGSIYVAHIALVNRSILRELDGRGDQEKP